MLSATLVAFTIECDNEVELGLAAQGRDSMVSLVAWLNVLQHLAADAPVRDLCARTYTKPAQVASALGCLERWGFVSIATAAGGSPRTTAAEGFGSGRHITASSSVSATPKGEAALALWPQVIAEVESRWRTRCGPALSAATAALSTLALVPGVEMPEGVPSGWMPGDWRQFPAGTPRQAMHGTGWHVLLSRALLAVTITYEERSVIPLALAANTLRVVEVEGTPVPDLHARSGISSEATGAQCNALTRHGLAALVKDSTRRGKLLRLTKAGEAAQAAHGRTIADVDAALGSPGANAASALRQLLARRSGGDLALRAALTPPVGVRRSGATDASLERAHTSVRARNRELVTQTEAFLADPYGALPHYPVWQGTRNFGP